MRHVEECLLRIKDHRDARSGGHSQLPYEIVVFNVGKDQITGYLSTPKEGGAAAAAPAAAPAKP